MPNPSGSSCVGNKSSFQAHLALEKTRSRRGAKTVLMWEQVSTRQRRLAATALLGLAPARSTRASAANHRKSISACRPDDSVIANESVTVTDHACPQPCAREGA